MKSKLALVLSGGFVKGVAHISIAEEMNKRGYVPGVFVGTSIGAVFSVLLGLYDDPKMVKRITQDFVKSHIWPQLVSIDIFSKAGLFESKEAIKLIAKEAGFAGKTFKALKKPVYVTSTDLNTGKLIVFGKDKNMLLSEALEASISFPVIFKPKKMPLRQAQGKVKMMALADGGIRENCPISVAAKIPGVKRIVACDLGYCGQSKGDFNRKNALDVFMQCLDLTTSFSQINRYINDEVFIKNEIAVRIINPGIFDILPFDFKEIPSIINRASKTAKNIFGRFKTPDKFFRFWKSDPFREEYMTVEHIGRKKTNAFEIIDFSLANAPAR
ncbi:MAG: patatin-like phospholipase family protein [Candidatus Margulisiibacteriota bacterium]